MNPGDYVFVYWNLHRSCWSVKGRGAPVRHAPSLTLERASFRVSEAGRQRVLRERKKNVHAGVRGFWSERELKLEEGVRVSYDPYRGPSFYRKDTGAPAVSAEAVFFRADRSVWAYGLTEGPREDS